MPCQVRVIEARNLATPDRLTTEGSGCDVSIDIKFVGEERVRHRLWSYTY